INHGTATTSGWYTFEHHFNNVGGVLTVDLLVFDSNQNLVFAEELANPADTIGAGGVVGGNRYGWFTNIDVAGGIAVDNLSLTTTGAQSGVAELVDGSPYENGATLGSSGQIVFLDADFADTHTISVTPNGSDYLGGLTATPGLDSTGGF